MVIDELATLDQDITGLVWELAAAGRHPLLWFTDVKDSPADVATNVFASRARIERMIGAEPGDLHGHYQRGARAAAPMSCFDDGPVLETVRSGAEVDIAELPLVTHFSTDSGPYITSGIMLAEGDDGVGNLSYHRATPLDRNHLATSLHSRRRPVAHAPQLRRARRTDAGGDGHRWTPAVHARRAGPRPCVGRRTPHRRRAHGDRSRWSAHPCTASQFPATPTSCWRGRSMQRTTPTRDRSGSSPAYSSDRSTRDVMTVDAVLTRKDWMWIDVVGGTRRAPQPRTRSARRS
ncbi:MAG: UbiD family decarboxylase domain-containing protein [Ilumatobacteraceae bacterium]